MAKKLRISLATKVQLLFGLAVVLILTAALAVVWQRMQDQAYADVVSDARTLAEGWLADIVQLGTMLRPVDELGDEDDLPITLTLIEEADFQYAASRDPFTAAAIELFEMRPEKDEYHELIEPEDGDSFLLYARAIRKSDLVQIRSRARVPLEPTLDQSIVADRLEMVLLVRRRTSQVEEQLIINRLYVIAAGLLAGLLAIGTFWFITTRIILSPVHVLKETAEKVAEGDLNIRVEITTGDEFERLAAIFNQMLENLKSQQDRLRTTNKSLDLKLGELAETNVALFEANKIKGEFLANVSHELRTPLNSIIGFAEVLGETLQGRTGPVDEKRQRYAEHIVTSSRQLLDLINDLLDLAKIEAGRMEIRVGPVGLQDTCEALINLIRPQAEQKQIKLTLKVAQGIPVIHSDAGKLHQIVANFLSNAVKFTPEGGEVTLSARVLEPQRVGDIQRVIVSVRDTGPGIPAQQQELIFEKFHQLDSTMTRHHAGTGLGLTISRELSDLLQGEVTLESIEGHGATFSLILPVRLESRTMPLMPELTETGNPTG